MEKNWDFPSQKERWIAKHELLLKHILYPENLTDKERRRLQLGTQKRYYDFSKISDENRGTLREYNQKKQFEDNCNATSRALYTYWLGTLALAVNKSFKEMTKQDIIDFISSLNGKSQSVINHYKTTIKNFFRWLYGMKKYNYPEIVDWIKATNHENEKVPEELITDEEILKMVEIADNPRDKALVMVAADSGLRGGELAQLKLKHIIFDEYGATILADSYKTHNQRRIRLINSIPALKNWVNNHPYKDDQEAPLWLSFGINRRHHPLYRNGILRVIKLLAKTAKIKKRVYSHLFRSYAVTQKSKVLSEMELKRFFGWSKGSSQIKSYIALSDKDVETKLLTNAGLLSEEKNGKNILKPVICIRCNESNTPDIQFCHKCFNPLNINSVTHVEAIRSMISEVVASRLMKTPEAIVDFSNFIKEWSEK